MFPACPIFDESGTGIIFHGYKLPIEKLGLNFCLNRPTSLYYIRKYEDESEDSSKAEGAQKSEFEFDVEELSKDQYFAGFARFSSDYKYLAYFSVEQEFWTHSTSFALTVMKDFALTTEERYTAVEREHESGEHFSGLFGYHSELCSAAFVDGNFWSCIL